MLTLVVCHAAVAICHRRVGRLKMCPRVCGGYIHGGGYGACMGRLKMCPRVCCPVCAPHAGCGQAPDAQAMACHAMPLCRMWPGSRCSSYAMPCHAMPLCRMWPGSRCSSTKCNRPHEHIHGGGYGAWSPGPAQLDATGPMNTHLAAPLVRNAYSLRPCAPLVPPSSLRALCR